MIERQWVRFQRVMRGEQSQWRDKLLTAGYWLLAGAIAATGALLAGWLYWQVIL